MIKWIISIIMVAASKARVLQAFNNEKNFMPEIL
jgi:hypothetical protein